jgi:aspartyl-tRNA(Asn)/glutamyl-tRNA(Gln) amidotransferase subunit C
VKITEKEVRYVADLANLNLTDAEVARFQADLDGILEHVDRLNEIDTSNVEPMAQVLFDPALFETALFDATLFETAATLRADVVVPPLGNQAALANAPQSGAGYFKVPKVIER